MFIFVQKFHIFFLGKKNAKPHLKCLCVCFAEARGDPSFVLLCLCASIVIVCELLAPFNEAVLTVTPWAGKCYYIHLTDRELKHIGTKWFVEVHTQCIAEQGLEIAFQITGLELLPEVLYSPLSYQAIPLPLFHSHLPTTTDSAPPCAPSHFLLGVRPTKSFKSPGTSQKVKCKKAHYAYIYSWHTSLRDSQPLRGSMESGLERKKWNSRNGFQKCHRDGLPLFSDSSQSSTMYSWEYGGHFQLRLLEPGDLIHYASWRNFFQCKDTY